MTRHILPHPSSSMERKIPGPHLRSSFALTDLVSPSVGLTPRRHQVTLIELKTSEAGLGFLADRAYGYAGPLHDKNPLRFARVGTSPAEDAGTRSPLPLHISCGVILTPHPNSPKDKKNDKTPPWYPRMESQSLCPSVTHPAYPRGPLPL